MDLEMSLSIMSAFVRNQDLQMECGLRCKCGDVFLQPCVAEEPRSRTRRRHCEFATRVVRTRKSFKNFALVLEMLLKWLPCLVLVQ